MTEIDRLSEQVIEICKQKGWSLDWDHRGVYLHLESSELIESIRGKRLGDTRKEAGDLLFTVLALLYSNGITFDDVISQLKIKLAQLDPLGLSIK